MDIGFIPPYIVELADLAYIASDLVGYDDYIHRVVISNPYLVPEFTLQRGQPGSRTESYVHLMWSFFYLDFVRRHNLARLTQDIISDITASNLTYNLPYGDNAAMYWSAPNQWSSTITAPGSVTLATFHESALRPRLLSPRVGYSHQIIRV